MKKIFFILSLSSILVFASELDMNETQNTAQLAEFKANYKVDENKFDPLYWYNKPMTYFNHYAYSYVLIPIAKGYDYVMPDPIQGAISNFFDNLLYPVRLINNLLQGKFENSLNETKRFLINTTIGFAGFSDAASMHFDLPKKNVEDLGQTFGYWGIGEGFPIVLPLIGQSNLRDLVGSVGDYFADPITYVDRDDEWTSAYIKAYRELNKLSQSYTDYEILTKDQDNLYEFLRDLYSIKRKKMIAE